MTPSPKRRRPTRRSPSDTQRQPAPLGLRVVELAGPLTGYVGWLLRGLGCHVTLVDHQRSGDSRSTAPRPTTWLHEHAGKTRRTLPGGDRDRLALDGLLGDADILLHDLDAAERAALGVDHDVLARHRPHLITVALTQLGPDGPRAGWASDDLVVAGLSGLMAQIGDADGPPVAPPCEQTRHLVGINAALGAMLAVSARRAAGHGQHVAVSALESTAASLETGALMYIHLGVVPPRPGRAHPFVAHKLFRTADGWMAGGLGGNPRMWTDLIDWVRQTHPELADELEAGGPPADTDDRWRVFALLDRFAAARSRDDLFTESRARHLPWAPVRTPAEVARCPQIAHRGGLVTVVDGAHEYVDIATPVRFDTAARLEIPPADTTAVEPVLPARSTSSDGLSGAPAPAPIRGRRGALDGVRVLDLTWVLAGPYATKMLADHGAEVIKVESSARPDPTRFSRQLRLDPLDRRDPDTSGYFNNVNRNKRSITLNLRTERGRELLGDLVETCDIVIDNYSAGALERMGLGIDVLTARKPDLISVSLSGVGSDGPLSDVVSYADAVSALSGLTGLTGDEHGDPVGVTFGLADVVAGLHAALGAIAALEHRARTGRGCRLDLSQLEAMTAHLGDAVLQAGNPDLVSGDADDAPPPVRGVFRCVGDDRWCVISASDDDGFARLATVITSLASSTWSTASGRRTDADKINELVATWTSARVARAAVEELQRAGVAAGVVQTAADLVEHDEQLRHLGFYELLDHPASGTFLHEGLTIRLSETPGGLRSPAPRLGEHTTAVFAELGLAADEISRLAADGVLA